MVFPGSIISKTPSTLAESAIGSATMAGGESIIAISDLSFRSASIYFILVESRSSVGLGGNSPLVITWIGGSPHEVITPMGSV